MTSELAELADDLVRSPSFRWVPGMLALPTRGMVSVPVRLTDERRPNHPDEYEWPHDLGLRVPDLSDPTTATCLLDMLGGSLGEAAARAMLALDAHDLMKKQEKLALSRTTKGACRHP
jgi:hypothetical protein